VDGSVLIADLPGLGRSSPTDASPTEWLAELLGPVRSRPVLIAHSAASAPVLRYAAGNPDRIAGVVLVSPYFLQQRPAWHLRTVPIISTMLRRATVGQLTESPLGAPLPGQGGGIATQHTTAARRAIESAAAQLIRPGVARRTGRWLHDAQQRSERASLRDLLNSCPVHRHLIAGDHDPIVERSDATESTTIPAAGHNPHLSHPALVATAIREFADQL